MAETQPHCRTRSAHKIGGRARALSPVSLRRVRVFPPVVAERRVESRTDASRRRTPRAAHSLARAHASRPVRRRASHGAGCGPGGGPGRRALQGGGYLLAPGPRSKSAFPYAQKNERLGPTAVAAGPRRLSWRRRHRVVAGDRPRQRPRRHRRHCTRRPAPLGAGAAEPDRAAWAARRKPARRPPALPAPARRALPRASFAVARLAFLAAHHVRDAAPLAGCRPRGARTSDMPCPHHAHTMHTACTHLAHAMHAPCTQHAHSMPMPCTPRAYRVSTRASCM